MHVFNQRILAEDLVRVRRPDDRERYAAAQRQARIDPNPHQIDAVIFALRRLREGGCILADEVGLGKTIEAGLVIAQTRAEGAQRILLIVPKSLIGQWQGELLNLFGIQARENDTSFIAPGVYLVGREFAGSERGAAHLGAVPPFDLAVIDEAHEIFAGLHKRFGADGVYDDNSGEALMADRVRGFLRSTPVLLLTATPMQNSLAELWGLVQYVEPTGTLLGDLATFREVFCDEDDRTLVHGQEHELQRRLGMVLQRTLRRQAQEFLDRPFTQRRCRLYEYAMSDAERSLYDDVTEYLLEPSLHAFSGRQRRLLLIGFHRRMASSIPALAASLENVAARLRRLGAGQPVIGEATEVLHDLEEDQEVEESSEEAPVPVNREAVAAELALVEDFVARAQSLPHDAKARSFQDAIRVVLDLARDGRGSGKAVVFTESINTQEYLRKLLLGIGLADQEITLFRGTNDGARAQQAHARWLEEEGSKLAQGSRPTREVAVRLALVHEFRTRSKVLVCTEAGAKGLNLQFCETVINYDLPWNPLTQESVWAAGHPFRSRLPAWGHGADRDDFMYEIAPNAVLYARPCRSKAGENDLAMALPAREAGDERLRIGCVHGCTFDIDGYQTNFPIRRDAGLQRGLDSLQSMGPGRLPRSFSRRCRIRCQIWAGESSGAICRSFLTASCVPWGPYFIPMTRTWSICGNQLKDWFAFLPLGSGPSSMSTSHCKSSALSRCDHVPNSWAPACDCANQSRGTAFVSASCLPRNTAAATADTHLLVISVK